MENCAVRGPVALCEHAALKMSAKVYGATTLGPYCKAGGELNNVIFLGYSNKAHDGFLGNSVIGEWCNLGADTNNSNLKNNYSSVEVFNYREGKAMDTGLTFCGLMMGDHSKSGINTMFNTGTVVGVSANVFGADFPPKFIPSFSWGGNRWLLTFSLEKSLEVAERVMERRNIKLDEADRKILQTVFEREEKYRKR
jgi:UDP-N-acetylglucosamine diphosphorylase/glucosamine-1-phosphate N-acetyltransferase